MAESGILVLVLLGIACVFFVTEWLRADLVALLLVTSLGILGILTPQETLSGFSRSAVITILAIFILTEAIARTGATRGLAAQLIRWGGRDEWRLIVVLMAAGALLSLFMNNIAAASVLLPVAGSLARERRISPSKLMMPLAFGTLLGGMATLFTTSNILVSAALRDANYPALGVFDFAPIGIPLTVAGVAYMAGVGRHLLPRRAPGDWERLMSEQRVHLADVYGLKERWFRARVPVDSPLVGRTLEEAGLGRELGVNVIATLAGGQSRLAPPPRDRLYADEILFLQARVEQVESLQARGLQVEADPRLMEHLADAEVGLFEVVLAPRSRVVNKTLREIHFREKFDLTVVALWRDGRPRRVGIGEMALQWGDALLVLGPRERARVLQSEGDYIVLSNSFQEPVRARRMPHAILIMAGSVLLAGLGWLPIAEAMLAGALATILVGALTIDEAYQAIELRSIFLIAGMLPVGLALTKTGAAAAIGEGMIGLLGGLGPLGVVAGVLVVTMILTQFMTGQATAVILAPIAIQAAVTMHSDPRLFALAVAYGSSLAFLTPLGHPANVLVMGPGGYRFADYVRVGALLTLLCIVIVLALLPFVGNL